MDSIFRLFNIEQEEKRLAGQLFLFSFVIGIARVFSLTASQAIFLDQYDAGDLAYVYVITSVATIAASAVYLRMGKVLSPRLQILGTIGFVAAMTILMRVALGLSGARWPAMGLAVWFYVLFLLTNLAFWATATKVLDIRQGKRLFSVVTSGDVVAFFFGGLVILPIVGVIGTSNLLLIAAAASALAFLIFGIIAREHSGQFVLRREEGPRQRKAVGWSSPYLKLMIAYFVLSAFVYAFVDNAFNDVAQRRFADVAQLARFFGTYSAVTAVVNFAFRSFATGRLINRFGVIVGIMALPVMILLGSTLVATSGAVLAATGAAFWLMTLTRMSDKIFRGVKYSSFATLYQPLREKGPAVQAGMEGIVDAAAMGLAGAALLLLHASFDIGAVQLSYFLIGSCAIWIGVSVALKREYVKVLANVLTRRRIGAASLDATDADIMTLVGKELESPHPENVDYALDLLEEHGRDRLPDVLARLLSHPTQEVRLEALGRIERHRAIAALPAVASLANSSHTEGALAGRAMRVLCALSEEHMQEGIEALQSNRTDIRMGALVGLLRSGSINGIVHAGAELLSDLSAEDTARRIFAARVLGEAGISNFYRQALQLLRDTDPAVRRVAVDAAAKMVHPQLLPEIVEALRDPETREAASEALPRIGATAVPALVERLERHADDGIFRSKALRLLGLIGGDAAIHSLWDLIELADREERHLALIALSNCAPPDTAAHEGRLRGLLSREAQHAANLFAAARDLAGEHEASVVERAIDYEISRIRHRVFLLLSLLYPDQEVLTAWDNYVDGDRRKLAYALELVDNFVSADLKALVFPVLEYVDIERRIAQLDDQFDIKALGFRRRLIELGTTSEGQVSHWTAACARHVAAELRVDPGSVAPPDGERSWVEDTLRLKGVEVFDELPEPVLAGIVPKLTVLSFAAGHPVFVKGDVGDGLYVVAEGSVRVHDGPKTLGTVRENQVFGEFTVLQSAPRTASATAAEPTRLVKFEQDDLYTLVAEQVSIARNMIEIIVRRLAFNRNRRRDSEGRVSRVSISLKPLE